MTQQQHIVDERPVLFNTEMVRAILDGRKTQTRRPIKPQPIRDHKVFKWDGAGFYIAPVEDPRLADFQFFDCPLGQPGDLLWVRETWNAVDSRGLFWDQLKPSERADIKRWAYVVYRATEDVYDGGYIPSIHMPRWACRLFLRVTDVRAERVQDISEEDARAEGVDQEFRTVVLHPSGCKDYHIPLSYHGGFANAIDSLYPGAWERNDWFWAVSFDVLEGRP